MTTVNLDRIADLLGASGIPAHVADTGGRTQTLMVGDGTMCGPGWLARVDRLAPDTHWQALALPSDLTVMDEATQRYVRVGDHATDAYVATVIAWFLC